MFYCCDILNSSAVSLFLFIVSHFSMTLSSYCPWGRKDLKMHFTHQTELMQDLRLLWPIYRDTSLTWPASWLSADVNIWCLCGQKDQGEPQNCWGWQVLKKRFMFHPCIFAWSFPKGSAWKFQSRTKNNESFLKQLIFQCKPQLISTKCDSSLSPNYTLSLSVTSNYSTTPPLLMSLAVSTWSTRFLCQITPTIQPTYI